MIFTSFVIKWRENRYHKGAQKYHTTLGHTGDSGGKRTVGISENLFSRKSHPRRKNFFRAVTGPQNDKPVLIVILSASEESMFCSCSIYRVVLKCAPPFGSTIKLKILNREKSPQPPSRKGEHIGLPFTAAGKVKALLAITGEIKSTGFKEIGAGSQPGSEPLREC